MISTAGRRILFVAAALAAPLHAQTPQPAPQPRRPANGAIVVGGDWLQANALPLDRKAMHSMSFAASYRRDRWAIDGGWLRVARDLSTIQGGFLSGGPILRLGRAVFIPAVGVLAGQAQRSVDSTGFDFVTPAGTAGHQPRFSYSSAGTVGAGLSLTAEYPIYRMLGFRAVASEWYFSGAPLEGDRARTLLGVGLSLRVWQ